jgi:23S rRNA pseudouridine2605 synthase
VRRARSTVDITIHEGRNRQVRRMFDQLDHPVLDLIRVRFGPVALGDLATGAVRPATEREVRELRAIAAAAS